MSEGRNFWGAGAATVAAERTPLQCAGQGLATTPAPEPVRDIQCQVVRLCKEVEALQSEIHGLLVRLGPVLGPESKSSGPDEPSLPPACTPLGRELQVIECIAYSTRLAVVGVLERLELP